MLAGKKEYTPACNMECPLISLVVSFVVLVWSPELFNKCGISNAMNGTKDDKLFANYIKSTDKAMTNVDDEEY